MTIPTPFNMAEYVLRHATRLSSKTALEVVGSANLSLTYADLENRVQCLAAQIEAQTFGSGDRVMLRLGNTERFPIAYLAAIAVDRVPIVTSSKLTQTEIDAMALETKPNLTIADKGLPTPKNVPLIDDMAAVDFNGYHHGDPNRPAYIIYTSGTSGSPRAVVHAHRAIWARRMMIKDWYDLSAEDCMMHAGAFNWTYTLGTGLMDPWSVGATALIPEEGTAAEALPTLIAEHKATLFAASPGVYRRMLRQEFPKVPTLRHALSAGEKLPDITRAHWETKTGTAIHEAYGMSECSTFLSGSPARPAPTGTLGFPQTGRKIDLISNGEPSETGVISIHKSDPGLMLGYLNQPQETRQRFNGDWFLTGDIGTRNPDGSITFEGRADDMMNAGGHRVSPIEVEQALSTCAKISEAACAEVRLKSDLSLIAAFYVASDVIEEDEIQNHLRDLIADYKRPRIFVRVDQLPRGNNNKLLRQKLKQDWEADHGQT
ncbi:Acyl-CoA synthetase (AMP-forming)/AMP-acid ligase II [Cognatiyoonia sediminum]|uniref:Acyl-CoA synthetase (AMP-forming)/AMP-acid ligase II n=1 Tax=Cognatiyoonia sediminum TaxID=1508389 RepID=A0A1M5M6K4_9RHOB|nr:class I adenylate-forming enzyme family protein [Cognatiyoonia sediminum]SHG72924.1 Acyl-CoA synthetase (AMP-forming)/AMP-acid ligase II [Cognatiyoonia sediminum]